MTVNTNNGHHPAPEPPAQRADLVISGHAVDGPDGSVWGALSIRTGMGQFWVAVPEGMLGQLSEVIAAKLAETADIVRAQRLTKAGLALPVLDPTQLHP